MKFNMTNLEEFRKKTFHNGDSVWIRRIDDVGTEFAGVVCGVHASKPFEHYIVKLLYPSAVWGVDQEVWDCVVISKGCLDERKENE